MAAAMAGTEILYIARPDGVLSKIDGLRRFLQRLLPTVPKEERAALEKRLSENRIENRTRAAWFETTEILSGQTLELGRDYFFDLPGRPTRDGFSTRRSFGWDRGRRRSKGGGCACSSPTSPTRRPRSPPPSGCSRRSPPPSRRAVIGKPAKGYSISGNASRLVDPATLLVWKDQTVRKVRNRLEVSEEMALTVSSEEKVDITLEPAPPAAAAAPATH